MADPGITKTSSHRRLVNFICGFLLVLGTISLAFGLGNYSGSFLATKHSYVLITDVADAHLIGAIFACLGLVSYSFAAFVGVVMSKK